MLKLKNIFKYYTLLTMGFKVSAPLRVDLSASWTDCSPYRDTYGGTVLNAAITLRAATTINNNTFTCSLSGIPNSSGLGSSAAVRTTFLAASNFTGFNSLTLSEKIQRVYKLENEIIGHRAGMQDQAAAIKGGVNLWEFSKNGTTACEVISKKDSRHLQDRLILVYTAEKHSTDVLDEAFSKTTYNQKLKYYDRAKEVTRLMYENVGNEKKMADLVAETRALMKNMYSGIETELMLKIDKHLFGEFYSWKAPGAGGCMLFYVKPENYFVEKFNHIKQKCIIPCEVKIIPVVFDFEGLKKEEL